MKYYTHSGLFHCDEVMGYTICNLAGICEEAVRLTDIKNIPQDGLIADIGREYSPENNKFDHHQGFLTRENGYPYASAGLLWKQFGYQVVFNLIGGEETENHSEKIKLIVERVDKTLIQGIDAHDSDSNYSLTANCTAGKVKVYSLPNVISFFNSSDISDNQLQQMHFEIAFNLLHYLLQEEVHRAWMHILGEEKFQSVAIVEGAIITLTESIIWKEIVHEKYPEAIFVISPSLHPGNPYSLTAVPVEPESREIKKPIEKPEWFNGFIHQGKWIAGGESIEELKRLAEFNLNL